MKLSAITFFLLLSLFSVRALVSLRPKNSSNYGHLGRGSDARYVCSGRERCSSSRGESARASKCSTAAAPTSTRKKNVRRLLLLPPPAAFESLLRAANCLAGFFCAPFFVLWQRNPIKTPSQQLKRKTTLIRSRYTLSKGGNSRRWPMEKKTRRKSLPSFFLSFTSSSPPLSSPQQNPTSQARSPPLFPLPREAGFTSRRRCSSLPRARKDKRIFTASSSTVRKEKTARKGRRSSRSPRSVAALLLLALLRATTWPWI